MRDLTEVLAKKDVFTETSYPISFKRTFEREIKKYSENQNDFSEIRFIDSNTFLTYLNSLFPEYKLYHGDSFKSFIVNLAKMHISIEKISSYELYYIWNDEIEELFKKIKVKIDKFVEDHEDYSFTNPGNSFINLLVLVDPALLLLRPYILFSRSTVFCINQKILTYDKIFRASNIKEEVPPIFNTNLKLLKNYIDNFDNFIEFQFNLFDKTRTYLTDNINQEKLVLDINSGLPNVLGSYTYLYSLSEELVPFEPSNDPDSIYNNDTSRYWSDMYTDNFNLPAEDIDILNDPKYNLILKYFTKLTLKNDQVEFDIKFRPREISFQIDFSEKISNTFSKKIDVLKNKIGHLFGGVSIHSYTTRRKYINFDIGNYYIKKLNITTVGFIEKLNELINKIIEIFKIRTEFEYKIQTL